MLRNLLIVVAGSVLSFVLAFAGSQAAWVFIVGGGASTNKEAIVRFMLVQTFAVNPGTAIIVGVFIASLVQRSRWWLGGITLLPLAVDGLIQGAVGIESSFCLANIALATLAAFVVSRSKRKSHFA